MGAPQYEQAGADVAGSGTAGTIPVWSTGTTLGDSGLQDNGTLVSTTTRALAIGRTSVIGTGSRLNVQLTGTTASGYTAPTNAAALFDCGAATNGGVGIVGGGALGYYFTNASGAYDGGVEYSARKLYLRSQGTQALTVDGANVGIGTASPYGTGPGLQIERAGGTTSYAEYLRLRNTTFANNSNTTIGFYVASNSVPTGAISHVYSSTFATYDTVIAGWNGTALGEFVRIQGPNGNVGIGTASPVEKLTVAGGITSTAANAVAGSFNGAVIDYSGGNMRLVPSRSGANAGAIQFFYTTSGGVITQGATLDSSSLNISLQSGYGLKLPATPGNSNANTLDCYADGGAGAGGVTYAPVDNSGAGLTFTVQSCEYVQIGRLIVIHYDITFPTTASAANVAISIPVQARAIWQSGTLGFQSAGAGGNIAGLCPSVNNFSISFYANGVQQTNANLSQKRMYFSLSYIAN